MFCSVPPVAEMNERNRKTHVFNNWIKSWCHQRILVFSDRGTIFIAADLFESGGLRLSDKDSRPELVGLIERALKQL